MTIYANDAMKLLKLGELLGQHKHQASTSVRLSGRLRLGPEGLVIVRGVFKRQSRRMYLYEVQALSVSRFQDLKTQLSEIALLQHKHGTISQDDLAPYASVLGLSPALLT